jgi:hypothetical protein
LYDLKEFLDRINKINRIGAAVPFFRTRVPFERTAVLFFRTRVPFERTAVPFFGTRVPSSAPPHLRLNPSAILDRMTGFAG